VARILVRRNRLARLSCCHFSALLDRSRFDPRRRLAASSPVPSGVAFAAGVILATGFAHMLDDATDALTDPCLPESPWRRFPFPGFIALLVADFVTTNLYAGKEHDAAETSVSDQETAPLLEAAGSLAGITSSVRSVDSEAAG
jgi:hypothetical protein